MKSFFDFFPTLTPFFVAKKIPFVLITGLCSFELKTSFVKSYSRVFNPGKLVLYFVLKCNVGHHHPVYMTFIGKTRRPKFCCGCEKKISGAALGALGSNFFVTVKKRKCQNP